MIKVENFEHKYSDGTRVKIDGKEAFEVNEGEKVAVIGANGSGKTTLLSAIMGLLKPSKGSVEVYGLSPTRDFDRVRKKLGVVLQNIDEQIIGPRVFDDIAFTLRQEGYSRKEVSREVKKLASLLGLEEKLWKIPHYLSGGEKQKVALAGALIHRPHILVLDEPLDSLDLFSRREVEKILERYNREYGVTIVLTTHDIDWIPGWAHKVYMLSNGEIIARGDPFEVLQEEKKLVSAGLEPPVLVSVFNRLKEQGYDGPVPITIESARRILADYLKLNQKK